MRKVDSKTLADLQLGCDWLLNEAYEVRKGVMLIGYAGYSGQAGIWLALDHLGDQLEEQFNNRESAVNHLENL